MVTVITALGWQKICRSLCGWIELFAGMDQNQCGDGTKIPSPCTPLVQFRTDKRPFANKSTFASYRALYSNERKSFYDNIRFCFYFFQYIFCLFPCTNATSRFLSARKINKYRIESHVVCGKLALQNRSIIVPLMPLVSDVPARPKKPFFVSRRTTCYGRRTTCLVGEDKVCPPSLSKRPTKLATKQALIFTVITYRSICML